jgi:hypothetical protein
MDGMAFYHLILGRKKAGNLFQISCLVCRFVGGGYLVVKVREQVDPMCEWQTVKETIGVGVNEKAALSSDKNCPFVYINFDFTLVNKVASL